jgi:hypothetical protein
VTKTDEPDLLDVAHARHLVVLGSRPGNTCAMANKACKAASTAPPAGKSCFTESDP